MTEEPATSTTGSAGRRSSTSGRTAGTAGPIFARNIIGASGSPIELSSEVAVEDAFALNGTSPGR